MLIVAAIGVLAFLTWVVPAFKRACIVAATNCCICNLRQIDGAKQLWALDNHKTTNDVPAWSNLCRYLRDVPACPRGGTYKIGRVEDAPECSIPGHALPHALP
jgi:hypothetical protein